ncbi:hypothetical protein [Merdimmobilis hominis]|uniref:hypothetical protein n=1 Tax=Merdimmobilis hominis TaxID=2897707 RepID=UPI00138FF109|nr:hypothetical protein [Merdimmobilis hominis]
MVATCTRCGLVWNVSAKAALPPGGYVCPNCRHHLPDYSGKKMVHPYWTGKGGINREK